MKVVILAGGYGTRLSEMTDIKPKPMIEIGGKPMLWHIMKIYSHYGFNEFVVCLGYKGYMIKEYFANYFLHQADITVNLEDNSLKTYNCKAEPWKISLIDTGLKTMTGGRIKRIKDIIGNETFMLTYGDGLANINIKELLAHHEKNSKFATVTAVQPKGRFGALDISNNGEVSSFLEKPKGDSVWVNGGFFVLEPKIFDYIEGDDSIWEREPLEGITKAKELVAYKHDSFWLPMDTLRDKRELEDLWDSGRPPWRIWEN